MKAVGARTPSTVHSTTHTSHPYTSNTPSPTLSLIHSLPPHSLSHSPIHTHTHTAEDGHWPCVYGVPISVRLFSNMRKINVANCRTTVVSAELNSCTSLCCLLSWLPKDKYFCLRSLYMGQTNITCSSFSIHVEQKGQYLEATDHENRFL